MEHEAFPLAGGSLIALAAESYGTCATWCSVIPWCASCRGADEPTLLLMTREYEGIDLNLGFINLTTASDKLAANELGWSVGMPLGGA